MVAPINPLRSPRLKKPPSTNKSPQPSAHHEYLRWVGLGFQLVAFIGLFSFGGWYLDKWVGNQTPWFTLGLAISSIIMAMVWLVVKFSRKS